MNENAFSGLLSGSSESKLQAYVQLYDTVEANTTYYAIPKLTTAQKWKRESETVNKDFEFTVKAFQGITHADRFGIRSRFYLTELSAICTALGARILLFQSPANFHPTEANIRKLRSFFQSAERGMLLFAWEPRGIWYDDPAMIAGLCRELDLIHCVDPFRNDPVFFGTRGVAYFRLHGFGRPNFYHYTFSSGELERLSSMIAALPESVHQTYVMFNNANCYQDAGAFSRIVTVQR